MIASSYIHGESNNGGRRKPTKEYVAWSEMFRRCYNSNCKAFVNYGGRGIRVCKRWRNYDSFLSDMGRAPGTSYTLGRIDNNGNYEPGNCEWQTRTKQGRNKRGTSSMTISEAMKVRQLFEKGKTQGALAKLFGVSSYVIADITRGKTWK
jgi:hypothetical protein